MTLRSLEISVGTSRAASTAAAWWELTKPRMVGLILVTTLAGFYLASPAAPDYGLLASALLGTALAAAGTLAINQYMERDTDALMDRTRRRPLPEGRAQPGEALAFGLTLAAAGLAYLAVAVNAASALATAAIVLSYLLAYTPLKRRSALCTIVGAIPGALPPVAGWAAASGEVGFGAAILFGIMFFWQMPHSLAIAILYRRDYEKAGMKLLPIVEPDGGSTKRQIVINSVALLAAGCLPFTAGVAGPAYLAFAVAAGAWMLWEGARAARTYSLPDARRLLYASFVYVPVVLLAMVLDRVPFAS